MEADSGQPQVMDVGLFECGHCGYESVADYAAQIDPYCYECDEWICSSCNDGQLCPQIHEGPAMRLK